MRSWGVQEGDLNAGGSLPRFRLHTFFKSPEGIYASVVPPGDREAPEIKRWQGCLSLNLAGRRLEQNRESGSNELRRQFELLHCECCGETFLGGVRGRGRHDDHGQEQVEELLPHEAETERLPDQPLAERFEDLSYEDYANVWQRDDNSTPETDKDNHVTWLPIWLDPVSGVLHRTAPIINTGNPPICFSEQAATKFVVLTTAAQAATVHPDVLDAKVIMHSDVGLQKA